MTKTVGYARTSTAEQQAGLDDQIRELTTAGCAPIFKEQVSSVKERAALDAALACLEEGDVFIVTKHDRLARSTRQFLDIIEDLNHRKIGLVILSMGGERIDSRSPTGKLILTVLASLAEFERTMMLARQKPGIAKARAEGKYKGAKPVSPEIVDSVIRALGNGHNMTQAAAIAGTDRWMVKKIVKSHSPLNMLGIGRRTTAGIGADVRISA